MAEYLELHADCKVDLLDSKEIKRMQEEERLAKEANSSKSGDQEVHE